MAYRYKSNKYGSKKVEIDGIVFDSKKEAKRFQELSLMEASGAIQNLQRQVKFILIPAQREFTNEIYKSGRKKGCFKQGKLLERECTYIADYTYTDSNGNFHVEDVKGYKGGNAYAIFSIKRKLMLYMHGIAVEEV